MKFKFLHLLVAFIFLTNTFSFAQNEATPSNDVFVTNEVSINSDQLEFSPTFFGNGILFISTLPAGKRYKVKDTRINKNIMSIFQTTRGEEGRLEKPEPFAIELLSTVHEGPLTFDRTAENIFFTRNNYRGKKRIKARDGIVKLQIYSAQRMDNVWKNVEKLPFNDRHSNSAHPSISVENDMLFFSSDRPGGMGGMDLYVSMKEGESWGEPINLGPKINTEKDEIFPFIHADGTLYFSSNGHAGLGELDILTTKKSNGSWEIPVNMGAPFNSKGDDFGIIIDRDKKNGYFSSSREGGLGQDDIYSFSALNGLEKNEEEIPDFEKTITVKAVDTETGDYIGDATVTYMKLDENSLARAIGELSGNDNSENDLVLKLPIDENTQSGLTDINGAVPIIVNRGNYVVKVEKEGYAPQQIAFNSEKEIMEYTIPLSKFAPTLASNESGNGNGNNSGNNGTGNNTSGSNGFENGNGSSTSSSEVITNDPLIGGGMVTKIEEGTVIELPNIYYNFNDAGIRPDARKDLEVLADFMKKYPSTEIELISHTDSRGTDRYNNRLSQRRAEEAVAFLVSQGISSGRATPRGLGETQLRNKCNDFTDCNEAEHQYNRRTEVKILKMDAPITVRFMDNGPDVISEAPSSVQNNSTPSSNSSGASSSVELIEGETFSSGDPSYDPQGIHQVIAGAFANISNAEKRLIQVRNLGYNNADILKFGNGGLFHVVVSKYSNSKDALKTVRQLKAKNVKSFVKK